MTDTQTKLLTVEDIRPVLLKIATENPDTVNPTIEGYCAYTDPDDPARHCIVGTLAAEMGWPIPSDTSAPTASQAAHVLNWPITKEAGGFLTTVQQYADSREDQGPGVRQPRPWGSPEVLAAIHRGEAAED